MEAIRKRTVRSYVRRAGRVSPARERAAREAWERWGMEPRPEGLPLGAVFPGKGEIVMEIGFGMGEATLEIARMRPDIGFLAVEVHHAGVAKLLQGIEEEGLENLRVMEHDAVEVLRDQVPEAGLDGVHIFFPDPWPKKKHHKRRMIQEDSVRILCNKLKTGGYIYTATDWEDYAWQMAEVFDAEPRLENPWAGPAARKALDAGVREGDPGWARGIEWRPQTRFEKKGMEKDFPIRELMVRKIPQKKGVSHES